jgi:methyl coenzyme M reductase subunit C
MRGLKEGELKLSGAGVAGVVSAGVVSSGVVSAITKRICESTYGIHSSNSLVKAFDRANASPTPFDMTAWAAESRPHPLTTPLTIS